MMTEAETGDENTLAITYSPVVQFKFIIDLQHAKIDIYNEHKIKHKNETILLARTDRVSVELNDFLLAFELQNQKLPKEKKKQSIVYYNGRDKTIKAARKFSDNVGPWGAKKRSDA